MTAHGHFDVAVVGGGPAGLAAALGAARAGAHTLLLERESALGGNVTQALVHTFCGLYRSDTPEALPVQAGLGLRLAEALTRSGNAGPPAAAGRVFYLPIRPAAFAALGAELCARTVGLTLHTRSKLVGLRLANEAEPLAELSWDGPDGSAQASASLLIDTSGDGAAAALAGVGYELAPPERLQRTSFIVRLEGVEPAELLGFARLQLSAALAHAASRGELPAECGSVVLRPDLPPGSLHLTLTLPAPPGQPFAPLDPDQLAALGSRARAHATQVVDFLRATRAGFARARVADWPSRVGVRETRRVLGRVVLEREDVLAGRRRADEVALSSWPIELWEDHRRARFEHPAAPCSIPLGALVSRDHARLGMAGRCLSASHEAHGALRVIGTALATGEAIGVAAAAAAASGVALAEVDPAAVRARIRDDAEKPLP